MELDHEHPVAVAPEKQGRPRKGTQLSTILKLLEEAQGGEVGIDVMMRAARCAACHSAVATLRDRYGFNIINRQERVEGVCHSFYRLEADAERATEFEFAPTSAELEGKFK